MNNLYKKLSENVGEEVTVGNDIEIFLNESSNPDRIIKIMIPKDTILTMESYSRPYGNDISTECVTFANEDNSFKFNYMDNYITFDKDKMTKEILEKKMMLLLIEA